MAIQLQDTPINLLPEFTPVPSVYYRHDYNRVKADFANRAVGDQLGVIRDMVLHDLFFIMYFIMQWGEFLPKVNRKFVVDRCYEVQDGPQTETLDMWGRYHFKSQIRSARLIQRVLKFPERCHMIGCNTRPNAKKHMRHIKELFEKSDLLKACFPDVLFENPQYDAPKWSEDEGIVVRRTSIRKESTIEAWGLIEGMPTGSHFDFIDIDDLETDETADNPEVTAKVNKRFDLVNSLLTEGGQISVWGTPYSHMGTYIPFLTDKFWPPENIDDELKPLYSIRTFPATEDGTKTGTPVLFSPEEWRKKIASTDTYVLNCQYLINPTPVDSRKLNPRGLQELDPEFVPKGLLKFLIIDSAKDLELSKGKKNNAWAIARIGIQRETDEWGASKCYIEDLALKPMEHTEAMETVMRFYMQGGMIQAVGVEDDLTGNAGHIQRALAAQGRYISQDNKTLVLLKSKGKGTSQRVVDALAHPLDNSKWFISKSVPKEYRERLYMEIDKFPHFHPDGLVVMAYLYDMIKDLPFMSSTKTKRPEYPKHAYGVV